MCGCRPHKHHVNLQTAQGLVGVLIYELAVTGVSPRYVGFDIVALRELMMNLTRLRLAVASKITSTTTLN